MKNKIIIYIIIFLTTYLNSEPFIDNKNGTITDSKTKLIWATCSLGQKYDKNCIGDAISYDWYKAFFNCQKLQLANKNWRLPTREELLTIVDLNKSDEPSIDLKYFPSTIANFYWSSNKYAQGTDSAWTVIFKSGASIPWSIDAEVNVRCVTTQ